MRIFQIVTLSELGGAQVIVAHLSNALAEYHELTVFAGQGDGKLFRLLDKRIRYFKINSLAKNVSPLDDIKTLLFLFVLYHREKPDIIHLHSSKAAALGRLIFPKNKTVYTVHGFDSIRQAHRRFLPLERYLQKRCRALVAVSRYDERNLRAAGITRNVSCIYNGIPRPAGETGAVLPVPKKYTKKILCIARISRQKRFDLFLETAKLLPEYAFIWIGNRGEIFGVPENVYLLGNLSNAGVYNRAADLFMLPSNYEGLPVVIIEAMSYGKPVIASAVGGIPELVEDGVNGYTVENTALAFAERIREVMSDEVLCKSLMSKSRERFFRYFTVEEMAAEYLKIYS
jgi:glycosyltransferase involved in cell wall biosynthesis